YFEHQTPADRKQYSKTRPITIDEFKAEKAWWFERQENEVAWRVSIEEIRARNYNLDVKNPHSVAEVSDDPAVLLAEYEAAVTAVQQTRAAIQAILTEALVRG
ncbi:MAG TPA: N-6 DNA methylase, partial [Chloroflexota bacterium]|nr:N-6 DNA methylase [Chloroflexota bacterium]